MRNRFISYVLYIVTLNLLVFNDANCNTGRANTAIKPNWIVEKKPEINYNLTNESGGYYYLLVDIQENISTETNYCHYAIKLLNNNGVQDMSDISVDFDPSFQTLEFHEINLYRSGIKINELLTHKLKIVQRETDMERFLYDGSLTAYVNLEDVREGDIIEYSYSLKGYNPIYNGNYTKKFSLEYNDPIKEIYRRLISPKNKQLYFNYLSGKAEPTVEATNKNTIYTWHYKDVKSHVFDNNVPSWYNDTRRVAISSLKNWNEVSALCLLNYQVSEAEFNVLKKKADETFGRKDPDSLLIPIIRFVQDQIRYLGFESGLNAYKPIQPVKVMESRYADCKAKSLLLCSLLKIYGIEAFPVLVNSYEIKSDRELLPSLDIFNHCIVQINYGNKVYTIDPTISNQGGTIENIYLPDYGYGLILKEGSNALVPLSNTSVSETNTRNYFKVNEIGAPVSYKIITEYSGYYADDQRSSFRSKSIDEISKSYLKFYSKKYPLIRSTANLKYNDNREINIFTVEEEYVIDSLWVPSESKPQQLNLAISALIINSAATIPASPKRTMPYFVSFPSSYKEEVYLELPVEWSVHPENKEIKDSVFQFSFKSSYLNKQIHLIYKYSTFRDYQAAPTFSSFYAKHQEVRDNLYYSLTYNKNAKKPFKFSWLSFYFFLIILLLVTYLAYKIYHNVNLPFRNSIEKPIGGWLVLIAIGLGISTIKVFYLIFFDAKFFNTATWSSFWDLSPRNIPALILLVFEFTFNNVLLIYLVLIQILFYKRRNSLPKLIIILYAGNLSFVIIDYLMAFIITPDIFTPAQKNSAYLQIIQTMVFSAIWITYFLKSQRVVETFTTVTMSHKKKMLDSVPIPIVVE